jgi:Glycosyl hydrolase family 59 central domain
MRSNPLALTVTFSKFRMMFVAHTTQFTQIGWNYLLHGAGVQKLDNGGSFVTLVSPDKNAITIVIETLVRVAQSEDTQIITALT